MAVKLKRLLGDGGAGIDQSHSGEDRLYTVLEAMTNTQNDLVAQFAQLRADVTAAGAFPITTSATDPVAGVEVE